MRVILLPSPFKRPYYCPIQHLQFGSFVPLMRSLPRKEIVDSSVWNAGKVATPPDSAMTLAPEYSTVIGQILIILSCHWSA